MGFDRVAAAVNQTPRDRLQIFGALAWTVSIVYFVTQAVAQAQSTRPYSLATNYISDLGNTACGPEVCSPLHTLVNTTFVTVGVLHALGALLGYRRWPSLRLAGFGINAMVIAGAGLVVAGLNPENVHPQAHRAGALVGLVALNLAMVGFGAALLAGGRRLGVLALAAGILGFLGFFVFITAAGGMPVGASERIADFPGAAMVVVLGASGLMESLSPRLPRPSPG